MKNGQKTHNFAVNILRILMNSILNALFKIIKKTRYIEETNRFQLKNTIFLKIMAVKQ